MDALKLSVLVSYTRAVKNHFQIFMLQAFLSLVEKLGFIPILLAEKLIKFSAPDVYFFMNMVLFQIEKELSLPSI